MPTTKEEVSYTFNTSDFLEGVDDNVKEDANFAAGEIALDAVKEYMAKQVSPVKGKGKFRALQSKKYKQYKQSLVGNKNPNLELTGTMKDGMYIDSNDESFTIYVDDENTEQAYNHNFGDTVIQRQFLPFDDGTFKKPIIDKIKQELAKYKRGRKRARVVEEEFRGETDTPTFNFEALLNQYNQETRKTEKQIKRLNATTNLSDLFDV